MRIMLLGFGKISYMPYLHFYLKNLKEHELNLVYWDRDGKPDSEIPQVINKAFKFESYVEEQYTIVKKIPKFLKYRRFVKKILKKEKYDYIIVLHSTPGITLLDYLKKHYKNKYILDYRDVSHESNKIYRRVVRKLVENSSITFVSSDAFRKYLPNTNKIHLSHNLLLDSLNYREVRSKTNRIVEPIRIRYWGLIRHTKINLSIIKSLANDSRFELHYHGREQETARILKKYCNEENVKNVFFHGEYTPGERYGFAERTDLIHNLYENDARTINATGNKIYDGIVFRIPQLCTIGSYMSEIVSKDNTGIGLNPYNDNFAEDIYNYYNNIQWSKFEEKCDVALNKVMVEYNSGLELIAKKIKK